ncbi:hypothetical protein KAR91_64640 [Candidatus Pacearchaeota archaeon]|nr:hypothetical protein [Candidatus Pacearchaeota archaeon]
MINEIPKPQENQEDLSTRERQEMVKNRVNSQGEEMTPRLAGQKRAQSNQKQQNPIASGAKKSAKKWAVAAVTGSAATGGLITYLIT